MSKKIRRIISAFLTFITVISVTGTAFADESNDEISLSLMCQNVAGLPIPSFADSEKRVVPDDEKELGKALNESGCDIVCVQEDFQYHSVLAAQMKNYPYYTFTSGGIPAGDGLNIFSKYPIYNVDRVAWNDFNGILTAANDGLTPKGFLKVTADVDGVLIDIYDIHADANGSDADCAAKLKQFKQLSEYIDKNSADRPVIITGDFNATFHSGYAAGMYETLIDGEDFTDAWVTVCNGGNYFRGEDSEKLINDWYTQYQGESWGLWDSVERFLYRDGSGAALKATEFSYNFYTAADDLHNLSDHACGRTVIAVDKAAYSRPDIALEEPTDTFILIKIARFIKYIFRDIGLIIGDLKNL